MSISSLAEDGALRLSSTAPSVPAGLEAQASEAAATPASPLAQLVKYVPTESITLYVAVQAALGDVKLPKGGKISDADFTSRWVWVGVMLGVTLLLTSGLSYRSQKNINRTSSFRWPVFDVLAACSAFMVWALSLPSTPLRDIGGYDYSAWNPLIILAGTVVIPTTAYVLGKTVSVTKVVGA